MRWKKMLSEIFFIWTSVVLSGRFSEAFICTSTGRYENTYDPTCKTYYLCSYNGQHLTSILYKCPNTFDPDTKVCSDEYICKRPEFSCSSSGYFPELNDATCTHYYNCFNFFGYYIKFSYSCYDGYQFDPTKRLCSSTYKCENYLLAPLEVRAIAIPIMEDPVEENDIESDTENIAERVETVYNTPLRMSIMADPIEETHSSTDMILEDLSTNAPSSTTRNEEFVCTESGMFPDKSDKHCSAYFYCIPLTDGTFVKRLYKCPNYFDPATKKCTNNYSCPYSGTTVEDIITTAGNDDVELTTTAITENDLENDLSDTTSSSINSNLDVHSTQATAEPNMSQSADMIHNTPSEIPIIEDPVTETQISENLSTNAPSSTTLNEDFVCTESGMFPDKLDKNCSAYFYCIPLTDGTFVKRLYKCPNYFDPVTKKCTNNYNCPHSETTVEDTITTAGVDDTEHNTKAVIGIDEGDDLGGTTETIIDTTVEVHTTNATETATKNIIETGSQNPHPESSSIYSSTDPNLDIYTTQSTTILLVNKTEFVYDTVGRFPDYSDVDCIQYILCSRLKNGTFLKTPYKCPKGSYFDPDVNRCSKTYQCHETTTVMATTNFPNTENPTTEVTSPAAEDVQTTDIHPSETENTSLKEIQSTEIPVTEAEKTPIEESEATIIDTESKGTDATTQITTTFEWDFSCSKVGRFKNENDSGCKSYFLCSQFRNGTFVKTQYDCPKSSLFSSVKHMCSDMISCVR